MRFQISVDHNPDDMDKNGINRGQHFKTRLGIDFLPDSMPNPLPETLRHAQEIGQPASGPHRVRGRALQHCVDHFGFTVQGDIDNAFP